MRRLWGMAFAVVFICRAALGAAGESPKELLEKGVYAEDTVGDLDGAVKIYRQIIEQAKADRAFVAQAHYRLGATLMKSGHPTEAFEAYGELFASFSDQNDLISRAQQTLAPFVGNRSTRNDPKSWFYFESRESGKGPRLILTFADKTAELSASQDTVLISYLADKVWGAHPQLAIAANDMNRALVQFPVTPVAKGATLTRAELVLTTKMSENPAPMDPMDVSIESVLGDWHEKDTSWMTQPATDPKRLALTVVFPKPDTIRVDVTDAAKRWLDGSLPNHGLMLKVASPFYGPAPWETFFVSGKYTAKDVQEMAVDTLFNKMIYGEVGRPYYAALWGLMAKANDSPDVRAAIIAKATGIVKDTTSFGYARWLCCYVLSGLRDEASIPTLTDALRHDPDSGVRAGAAGALGEYNADAVRALLSEPAANESSERVKAAIEKALSGEGASDPSKREYLAKEFPTTSDGAINASPAGGPASDILQKITMKKEELIAELSANYAEIMGQLNPEEHRDAAGNVDGYTSRNLSSVPLTKKLGLRDNDVLQQINGVTIDSPEKIVEAVSKFKDSPTYQLTIQRNGKRQVITYNLEAEGNAEDLASKGWALWKTGKFAEAEDMFLAATTLDPNEPNSWNGLGWSLFNQGRSAAAKEAFTKCVGIEPKHPAALNGLGWIAKDQSKVDEAISCWEKAIAATPGATAALNGLATTYLEKGQPDKAATYYEKWLAVEPQSSEAKAGLAATKSASANPQPAEKPQAATPAPAAPAAAFDEPSLDRMAHEALDRGDLVGACDAVMRRVMIRKESGNPYKDKIDLALILSWRKEKAEGGSVTLDLKAQRDKLMPYLAQHESDPEYAWRIHHLLSAIAGELGNKQQAGEEYDKAIAAYPDTAYADPAKHSKFQHLVNERAGLIWDAKGEADAVAYALDKLKTDKRCHYFFDAWWREQFVKRDGATEGEKRFEALQASVKEAYEARKKNFPDEKSPGM